MRWGMINVTNSPVEIPSVKTASRRQKTLTSKHGCTTTDVRGSLGNNFSINSLEKILAHVRFSGSALAAY